MRETACRCCAADITDRDPKAKYCLPCCRAECARGEWLDGCRVAVKQNPKPRACVDCGDDISSLGPQAQVCKPCRRKRLTVAQRLLYQTDPTRRAKTREAGRQWYSANKEKAAAQSKKWRTANPTVPRANRLLAKYGLTLEDYDRMYAEQGGRCASCGDKKEACSGTGPRGYHNGLVIDHCHETGTIRKLLCSTCNKLEGFLRKNPRQYRAVLEYQAVPFQ